VPTYDYRCAHCGGFDALRSVSRRNEPADCPGCGSASPRVMSAAPSLALMPDGTRHAIKVNERAAHEPKRSGDYARLRHPSGCGCCSSARRGATVSAPNGAKAFPSKRPWMISH
jgi:putative FmdB family regulatory protein